jgi:hypothetical protein
MVARIKLKFKSSGTAFVILLIKMTAEMFGFGVSL